MPQEVVRAMGAEIELHIDVGYPTVYNDEKLYKAAGACWRIHAARQGCSYRGSHVWVKDFGYYTQQMFGCFYRLGVMNIDKGITPAYIHPHSTLMKGHWNRHGLNGMVRSQCGIDEWFDFAWWFYLFYKHRIIKPSKPCNCQAIMQYIKHKLNNWSNTIIFSLYRSVKRLTR